VSYLPRGINLQECLSPNRCERLSTINRVKEKKNLQPISISKDGEITWVNKTLLLNVQGTFKSLLNKVTSLKAEIKALEEIKPNPPRKEVQVKSPQIQAERKDIRTERGGRGREYGPRGRGREAPVIN
jgi:hypothetical protein